MATAPGGICFEKLHEKAQLIHGGFSKIEQLLDPVSACDAAMMIGQHAMAGIKEANLNHTQSDKTIEFYKLNGKKIGEISQFFLYAGTFDVPVIFLSGDEAACNEAKDLVPEISTVSVKQGLGRNCAISLSAKESCRRIREGIRKALCEHSHRPISPLKWDPPYVLEKRFFHTDTVDRLSKLPNIEIVDELTVRIHGDDIKRIVYA